MTIVEAWLTQRNLDFLGLFLAVLVTFSSTAPQFERNRTLRAKMNNKEVLKKNKT
jgi:hypothetical protein